MFIRTDSDLRWQLHGAHTANEAVAEAGAVA
jgi:hypothetical protein